MRKNFDMDAAIRRALRESIEAHAHEWEPKFETGVGPVGDDAPFDKKVSGDVNECGDKENCCQKCGKCPCKCDKVNEGTIPADSHEWEPGFETGVGPVGDDSPFTQAVNEAFVEGGDWEKDSFGAPDHKKEGISFADGGDECQNGVVATSQKNSGEVVSSDNLSEGEDEGEDEALGGALAGGAKYVGNKIKNAFGGLRDAMKRGSQAQDIRRDRRERDAGQAKVDAYNEKYGVSQPKAQQSAQQQAPQAQQQPAQQQAPQAQQQPAQQQPAQQQAPQAQQPAKDNKDDAPAMKTQQNPQQGGMSDSISKADLQQWMQNHAGEQDKNGAWENLWQFVTGKAQLQESKEEEKDVIAEERDRFFSIINRIEKLYD